MNKLGVIQIIDSLNTGGAEVLAVNIANSLLNENVNTHLCVTRKEGNLKENIHKSVGYVFLDRKNTIDLNSIFQFKKYIRKNKISIIHAHATSFFFAFCVKLVMPKIKIVWHDHYGKSQELETRSLFPLKIISFFFSFIISVNHQLENWSKKNLNCNNIIFINNFPSFNNLKKITTLKGIADKRIIHLAAFREQKDHITLIKAFQLFHKKNNDWSLHLVGPINNDSYSSRIINYIKNKKLEQNIHIYGSCLDVSNILKQATIGVLSSKSEGLPISLLEYGLAKLPVIVTNVGDCAKVIENNKSGLLIEPKSYAELSKAFNNLAQSKTNRFEFGKNIYNNVIKNYSEENFISKTLKIYNSICYKKY